VSEAIIYNLEGRILRSISTDMETILLQAQEGEFLLLDSVATPDKYYVLNGEVLERPNSTTNLNKNSINADGVDSIIFSDVPKGFITISSKDTRERIDGEIENTDTFSTTIPGTYAIYIHLFPYLDFEATIEAS
jgi:hypothetical protein